MSSRVALTGAVMEVITLLLFAWLRILAVGLAVIVVNEAHKWRHRRRDATPASVHAAHVGSEP